MSIGFGQLIFELLLSASLNWKSLSDFNLRLQLSLKPSMLGQAVSGLSQNDRGISTLSHLVFIVLRAKHAYLCNI
jgi:hypothetical protein